MKAMEEESRVAIIGIIIDDAAASVEVNALLHQYGRYIIGRMGLPYRERGINIISIVLDAPQSVTSGLSGKIGRMQGVSTKTIYSK